MIENPAANLIELEFRRDENKYFIPPSFADQAVKNVEQICLGQGCEKEVHEHPLTRSAYYYLGDTDSMPPGFSVRYREYVDKPISMGGVLGENPSGFYEIKWLDQYESGRPIKRKLRMQGDYFQNISLDDLKLMAAKLDHDGQLRDGVLPSLDKQLETITQNGFQAMSPLFVVEYERSRYLHNAGGKKNIVSVDQNIRFYQTTFSEQDTESKIQAMGGIDGCIVEYKESSDDTKLRWQLYRTLVASNGTRFYGKKGEALNLLQRLRSKNAPPIRNELKEHEVESKLDILTDLQHASRLVSQLYNHFDQDDGNFVITPHFGWVNSQSVMGTYVLDPHDPNREGKLLVGLDAKYSTRKLLAEDSNGVLVRQEDKGSRFEYSRQQAREAMQDMQIAGKTQRIRRAFYLSSKITGRVYKLSVDFNWKLPIQEDDFFSQLEVEYTGIPVDKFSGSVDQGTPQFEAIKAETNSLTDEITLHLNRWNIPYNKGQRKVDMLST